MRSRIAPLPEELFQNVSGESLIDLPMTWYRLRDLGPRILVPVVVGAMPDEEAYRLGSIDPESKKPFTLLEYEKAVELDKEILIYMANDEVAAFPSALMDDDARTRRRLAAFKAKLRERHTVGTFSTPQDLAEKLSRDFQKHFLPKEPGKDQDEPDEDAFKKTARVLKEFRLTPKRYNGFEVRLRVIFNNEIFPASRTLCEQFSLEYGFTLCQR